MKFIFRVIFCVLFIWFILSFVFKGQYNDNIKNVCKSFYELVLNKFEQWKK